MTPEQIALVEAMAKTLERDAVIWQQHASASYVADRFASEASALRALLAERAEAMRILMPGALVDRDGRAAEQSLPERAAMCVDALVRDEEDYQRVVAERDALLAAAIPVEDREQAIREAAECWPPVVGYEHAKAAAHHARNARRLLRLPEGE